MHIAVVGSVNLDIVATGDRLPRPGETVTGAMLARHPGGKGANQALAARRLGAEVSLLACVGRDAAADEALALLRAEGVGIECLQVDANAPTGVALIAVAAGGENQIVVAPGANRALSTESLAASYAGLPTVDATICQLEVPMATVVRVAQVSRGLLVVNLAPAMPVDPSVLQRAGVLVVNETEAEFYGAALHASPADVVVTAGARGASLWRAGRQLANAEPPRIEPVDTTGAGDAFVAALTVALLEKLPSVDALRFACAAGAAASLRPGAQPALPRRPEVLAMLGRSR